MTTDMLYDSKKYASDLAEFKRRKVDQKNYN